MQAGKAEAVAAVTGTRRSYVAVDLKTGQPGWLMPLTAQVNHVSPVTLPLISGGVMFVVKDSKLMAVPLE